MFACCYFKVPKSLVSYPLFLRNIKYYILLFVKPSERKFEKKWIIESLTVKNSANLLYQNRVDLVWSDLIDNCISLADDSNIAKFWLVHRSMSPFSTFKPLSKTNTEIS